jgi:hypothetical protein
MPDLPRALPALANAARVALDGPRPSPELLPPLPAERHVVLTAVPSPCHSEPDTTGSPRSTTDTPGHLTSAPSITGARQHEW